jgi:hypothetical protein
VNTTVTFQELSGLLTTLNRQDMEALAALLSLRSEYERQNIQLGDRLAGGVYEFLVATAVMPEARRELIDQITPMLRDLAKVLPGRSRENLPSAHVVFAEQRYVSWPMADGFYDMVTRAMIPALPDPAVTFVVCDVTALYLRQEQWLKRLRGLDK